MRALVLATALIVAGPAQAADIDALITTAMKAAIDELVPSFERDTGHAVPVNYGPSGGIARRFIGGEPADLIVIDSGALEPVLEPWWQRFSGPFLYYSGRRLVPAPLRAFIDFLRASGQPVEPRSPRRKRSAANQ